METLSNTLRALVIDDNATNRMLAMDLLNVHQIEADDALEGSSGLGMLRRTHYDLVFLDISMPGLDGEEVCRKIRNNPATRDVYIVAYTAHAFPGHTKRIIEAGFDALLIKPISLKSLTKAIEPILTREQ